MIQIPFRDLHLVIEMDFLIISDDIPSLLSMTDMMENGLDICLQDHHVSFGAHFHKLKLINDFLRHESQPTDIPFTFHIEAELRRIHRNFGHPSIRSTEGVMKRATGEKLLLATRRSIEKIMKHCSICATHARAPRKFKLTVGADELRFNHTVQLDTMLVESKHLIHMVGLGTHLCAESFLRRPTTAEIWRNIRNLCSPVYTGPLDFLSVDKGTAYKSREMKENLEAEGIKLIDAPIETPGKIGVVERYHAHSRAAFTKLRTDLSRTTSDYECLQMALFAVNNTIGPAGLCPTLFVFGAIPRPARTTPSLTQLERAKANESAMREAQRSQMKKRISFGLTDNHTPKGF